MPFSDNIRTANRFRLMGQRPPAIEEPDISPYVYDGPPSKGNGLQQMQQAPSPVKNNYYPHGMDVKFQAPESDKLRNIQSVSGYADVMNPISAYQKEQSALALKKLDQAERFGQEKINLAEKTATLATRKQAEIERAGAARSRFDEVRNAIARIQADKTLPEAKKLELMSGYAKDLERLQQEGDIASIGAQSEARQTLERLQQQGRIDVEAAGDENEPGNSGDDMLPTQQKVNLYLKAVQVLNSTPEFKKYIRVGNPGTNDFQIRMPQGGNQQEFEYIRDKIYGKGGAPVITGRGPGGTAPNPTGEGPIIHGTGSGPIARPAGSIIQPDTPITNSGGIGSQAPPTINTPPEGLMQKKFKNKRTGEIKVMTSKDGGKTWN